MRIQKHGERVSPFGKMLINADVMFTRYKVSAINFKPEKWNKAENADMLEKLFRQASKKKPDLIVAPEGILEGYVITDVIWHRERVESFLDIAEPLDGVYVKRFRRLAKELNTCLCFGFAQRVKRDIYNSAVFIDNKGNICGVYHKVAEGTRPHWNFCRQGDTIRPFDTPLGRCGILICADRWLPLTARSLVLHGAQFILIPSFGSVSKSQNETVIARARENGVPIVEANVGMNLIINKGEVAGYDWGYGKITTAIIDVPVMASRETARKCEREFISIQKKLQLEWYKITSAMLRKKKPTKDLKNSFLSESKFRLLKKSNWGKIKN